ncbi:TetR/AcrR family transcriptional regulator [Treponema primitia]|uniref:TetR/AcrR family transcriptional regulator n=1 Tax=Treponema primitia TaxID=88058 RepID=UPI003981208E
MAGKTKVHDKQVENSRACIVEALLRLMESIPYTKISVSDIIEKAGVSRQTFYRHYEGKDDVIRKILENCFAPFDLRIRIPIASAEDAHKDHVYAMSQLLEKLARHGKTLKIMLNSEAEPLVYQYGKKWETNLINLSKGKMTPQEKIFFRYMILFSSSGVTQVICDWIKNDMPIPVEKLIEWLIETHRALFIDPGKDIPKDKT